MKLAMHIFLEDLLAITPFPIVSFENVIGID